MASPIFGFKVLELPYRSIDSNHTEPLTPYSIPASWTGYVHTRSNMHWTKACVEAWLCSGGLKRVQCWSDSILQGQVKLSEPSKNVGLISYCTSKLDLSMVKIELHWNQNQTPWEDVGPWAATSRCQGSPWLNHSKRIRCCNLTGVQKHIPIWEAREIQLRTI